MLDKPTFAPTEYDPGRLITRAGIYANVDIDRYHGDLCDGPSVSKSGLHTLVSRSPAHFWDACPWNMDALPRKRSDALDFGKAVHMLLLGEKGFCEKYVLKAHEAYRSNEAKAWRDHQEAGGKTIISQGQIDQIRTMRDSLAGHQLIQQGVLNGRVEMSLFTKLDSGIWLKSRPDVIPMDSGFYADLKTCVSIEYDDLERTIWNYGYHIQAAVVRMCAMALGLPFEEFVLVFVEKTPPHVVRPIVLKSSALDFGQTQALLGLKVLAECLKRNEWPGPQGFGIESEYGSIPGWAEKRFENQKANLERMIA